MKKNNEDLMKHAMTYGAIAGTALVIYSLMLYFLNLTFSPTGEWLSYLLLIASIIIGTKNYREKILSGSITYGQAVGYAVLISSFASIILAFYNFVLTTFIDPNFIQNFQRNQEELLLLNGMSEAQVERLMEYTQKNMSPAIWAFSVALNLVFWGLIFSLITSIFLKKVNKSAFDQAMQDVD